MGLLASFLGETAVSAVQGVANVVDQFVETDDEKRAAEILKAKMVANANLVQVEVNKIEAAHRSIWVAGWRPGVGWICVIGLSFPFVLNPILQWTTGQLGPQLPLDHLMNLVYALLGLGAYRTVEKIKGRTK